MTRRAFLLCTGLLTASWSWAGQVERLEETKEEAFRLLEDDKVRLAMIGDPEKLTPVRAQFEEDTRTANWTSLIPDDAEPPIEMNADKMEKFRPLLEKYYYDLTSDKTYIEQLGIEYPTVRK